MIRADVTDVLAAARLPLARTSPEGLRATWDGGRILVGYIAAGPAPGLHIREDLAFGRAAAALRSRGWARPPGTRRPPRHRPGDRRHPARAAGPARSA